MATEAITAPVPALGAGRSTASVRFLLRDSAVYGVSNALVKLTAIVTVPILTRTLRPADYGATDALSVLLALLVAVSTLGQDSAVARFFYDVDSPEERAQIVTQGLIVQVAVSAVVCLVALLLGPTLLASRTGRTYASAYYLVVACMPVVLLFQFWRGLLKWLLARNQFLFLSVGTAILNLGGIVGLATTGRLSVESFFVAMLAANACSAALGLYFCRSYVTRPRGYAYLRPMLKFGAPYAVVLLAGTALPAMDRAIVSTRLGLEPLAQYAVGMKYASLLLFPVMAFQTAWGPFCYSTYRDPSASQTYGRVLSLLAAALALACFALVALAEPLIRLFASATYASAAPLVVPIAFGLAFEGCSWILGIGIDLSKRSELSLASYVTGLATSVALALLLVGRYGVLGVAAGVSLGRATQSVVYSILGLRAYPMTIPWRRPLLTLLSALALSVLVAAVRPAGVEMLIAFRGAALLALLLVISAALGVTSPTQLRQVVRRIRPPTRPAA